VAAGARVEAFVGETLCGHASVRTGVFERHLLHVVGPDSIPGCHADATITLRVDGALAKETIGNGGPAPRSFDLTVR